MTVRLILLFNVAPLQTLEFNTLKSFNVKFRDALTSEGGGGSTANQVAVRESETFMLSSAEPAAKINITYKVNVV